MGRTATYDAINRGDLLTIKIGRRRLIDVEHGLCWMQSKAAPAIADAGNPAARHLYKSLFDLTVGVIWH
jgi:hypothetical protein